MFASLLQHELEENLSSLLSSARAADGTEVTYTPVVVSQPWVGMPALPFTSCVILVGKS